MTLTTATPLRRATEWWQHAVAYQVYPRSFADSDGDGIGDLRGVLEHVDHLADLGVDIVWLSPVYASPHDDNGYDIADYQRIDPVFGTLDDLDELVAALHARGIRLIMDLVVNHTSDEHPWFVESRASRDSPKRDWYWWRDPRDPRDGGEPNDWRSFFSGPAWTLDESTGQYYLHLFSRRQPDLNWEHPEVRREIHRMMRWWLDRGIDGFRMDVINFISKDPALPDGDPVPDSPWSDGSRHFANGPRIHEFLAEMRREVFDGRDAELVTVGEMPGVTPEQARLYTDPARRELDMVFQFEHVGLDHGEGGRFTRRPVELLAMKLTLDRWQRELADVGWNSLYLNNHDQPRSVSRFGDDGAYWAESATAIAALLHCQRGTPFIYQGEEIGMTNAAFADIEGVRDIQSLNYYREALLKSDGARAAEALDGIRVGGRDNARTPMQWTAGPNAGFTAGEPWIGVNPNHAWLNAEAQRDEPGSVLAWYRELIRLRHEDPLLVVGRFELLEPAHPQLFAYQRVDPVEGALLVAANCSRAPIPLPEALAREWADARLLMANHPPERREDSVLAPWEARILRRGGER